MIEGWIGRPGAGKTYSMTAKALRVAQRAPDKYETIWTNYPLAGMVDGVGGLVPNARLYHPDHLLDLGPGLILCDEAHLYFSARAAMRLPASWLQKMSQTRKSKWDIWWSAQHERRVDTVLKDVTNWMWLCNAWFPQFSRLVHAPPRTPALFSAKSYEPENFRKKDRHFTRQLRRFDIEVANAYDTMETVAVAGHTMTKAEKIEQLQKMIAAAEASPESADPREVAEYRQKLAALMATVRPVKAAS